MQNQKFRIPDNLKIPIFILFLVLSCIVLIVSAPNQVKDRPFLSEIILIIITSLGFYFLIKAIRLFTKKKIAILFLILSIILILPSIGVFWIVEDGSPLLSPCTIGGDQSCFIKWRIFYVIYYCLTFINGLLFYISIGPLTKLLKK